MRTWIRGLLAMIIAPKSIALKNSGRIVGWPSR